MSGNVDEALAEELAELAALTFLGNDRRGRVYDAVITTVESCMRGQEASARIGRQTLAELGIDHEIPKVVPPSDEMLGRIYALALQQVNVTIAPGGDAELHPDGSR